MTNKKVEEIEARDAIVCTTATESSTADLLEDAEEDRHALLAEVTRLQEVADGLQTERKLLCSERDTLWKQRERYRQKAEKLRETLKWYSHDAWQVDGKGRRPIDADRGSRAAAVLRKEA